MKQVRRVGFATAWLCVTALLIAAFMVLFSYSGCSSGDKSKENSSTTTSGVSDAAIQLKDAMDKLWEDHVTWTRNVILCLVDGVPGADQAVNRLMQNQVDIGNAIKPYYGMMPGIN
jgi:hypothetical protein